MSQKKLNTPDAFQVQAYTGLDYLLKHKVKISLLIAAILIVFGAWTGYKYTKKQSSAKRQDALAKIDEQYIKEEEEASKKRQDIDKDIQALSASITPPATTPGATPPAPVALTPETKQKIEALRAQADAIEANHDVSTQQYADFFKDNQDNAEGWYAALRQTDHLLKAKKTDEARKVLETVAEKSKGQAFYEVRSKFILAAVAEDAKDYDQALKLVDELLSKVSKDLQSQLLLSKARLLVAKNNKTEANTVLDTLLKDHADSPVAEKARGLKSLIN